MTINLKNWVQKANLFLIMICSFVGVGFVSGAEIYEFFLKYGNTFYLGLIVFFVLVFFIIYKMLILSKICTIPLKNKKNNSKINKNDNIIAKKIKITNIKFKIRECIFAINVFVVSSAMFAGIRYFLQNIFSNNFYLFYFASLVLVFLILLFGVKLLSAFDILVFVFIFGLFIFYIFKIKMHNFVIFDDFLSKNALFSVFFAVLYVFMNLFQMQPIIDVSQTEFANKKSCRIFAFSFALFMTSFLLVFILMLDSNKDVLNYPMPFLEYFLKIGGNAQILFCIGLILAILSTQVSGLIGFKNKLSKIISLKNIYLSIVVFFVCFIFGFVPFKIFVSFFYPILGFINLFAIVFC